MELFLKPILDLLSGPTIVSILAAVGAIIFGVFKSNSAKKAKAEAEVAKQQAQAQKGRADAILKHSQDNAATVAAGSGKLPDIDKDIHNRDNRTGPTT